jgi:hypothetical protein
VVYFLLVGVVTVGNPFSLLELNGGTIDTNFDGLAGNVGGTDALVEGDLSGVASLGISLTKFSGNNP